MLTIKNKDKLLIAAGQKIREKEYWLKKLSATHGDGEFSSGFPASPEIPAPGNAEPVMEQVTGQLPDELTQRMMSMSGGSDVRLHLILTACVSALLAKYSGCGDVSIVTPILRPDKEADFLNTALPLRSHLTVDTTFKELLLQIRQTFLEAGENQDYPMEILAQQLGFQIESGSRGFQLFDTAVVLENVQEKNHLLYLDPDLWFIFHREAATVSFMLEYLNSRYSRAGVQRIAGHLLKLLQTVLFQPHSKLFYIDIVAPEETGHPGEPLSDSDLPDQTIGRWFESQAQQTPGVTAMVAPGISVTYSELNEKSNRIARLLRDKGVTRESLVGLLMERSIDMVAGLLGIIKAGGAYLPIDPAFPEQRIRSILDESNTRYLITSDSVVRNLSFSRLQQGTAGVGEPVVTAQRPPIADLNNLPIPDRTLVNYGKYHPYIGIAMARHTIAIQATRGCPYNCAYCHKIWPKKHLVRNAEHVFQEIENCFRAGVRRFVFIDDIFNLEKVNSRRLLEMIRDRLNGIQLFFPNGLRGDILTEDFIDLMVQAGTVNMALALESASPRIQKLIGKNLNLDKFARNVHYITEKYPHLILEMEMMIGFPTETEDEALLTLDFLKQFRWIDFPNLHILKIYPNTDMYRLAVKHGVSVNAIENSVNYAYHELPETLPFPVNFVRQFQARFTNEYLLRSERLAAVIPQQMKLLDEDELVQKYDSYFPQEVKSVGDVLQMVGLAREQFGEMVFAVPGSMAAPGFNENFKVSVSYPSEPASGAESGSDSLRILLLDLSLFFSSESDGQLYNMVEAPLGLMYLLTTLKQRFGGCVCGKIAKSCVDFDSFDELRQMIIEFKPEIIGLRALSYHKEFFHRTAALIREWGIEVPVVTGGPYASSEYNALLQDPRIDLAVMGEGENTFSQLVDAFLENNNKLPDENTLRTIPGIAFMPAAQKQELAAQQRQVILVDQLAHIPDRFDGDNQRTAAVMNPHDLLYLISTSGSTGKPKSVMMEHRNIVNLMHYQFEQSGVKFEKVLQFASISFDVATQEIFTALLSGGTLYLIDEEMRGNIGLLSRYIKQHCIDVLYLPPAFLKFLFEDPEFASQLPGNVKHIITAGEQLKITSNIKHYLEENNITLHNQYGPAETHVVTTYTMMPGKPVTEYPAIGKAIANTKIIILDKYRMPVPVGIIGEIYIAGANVGRGYLNRPELTSGQFTNLNLANCSYRTYKSGDLAMWLPDGNIRFIGRTDQQVKIRGFRIEMGEIESRLRAIPRVKEAVVLDFTASNGDRFLCAYIVSAGSRDEIAGLRQQLAFVLPDYMVPAFFVKIDSIPLTPNGKVDRRRLPEPERDEAGPEHDYASPSTPCQEQLVELWSGVLEIDSSGISIDDNFFELGGHSLKGTVLVTRVQKFMGRKLLLVDLFRYPTIRDMAALLESRDREMDVSTAALKAIPAAELKQYYDLSPSQKRIYTLQQLNPMSTVYNIPLAVKLEGHVEQGRLNAAFNGVIRRHESLRTSFETIGGRTVQRIHDAVEFKLEILDLPFLNRQFIRPFELTCSPLLRGGICNIGEEYILALDMHHIISDGVSTDIFIRDFLAFYRDDGENLPELSIQYKDFSLWQNRRLTDGILHQQEQFWLESFSGSENLPELELPIDFPRPHQRTFDGDIFEYLIDPDLSTSIGTLAKETGTTLYMVMLAALKVLLFKYSGQTDIVVGSPVNGRTHADLENILGVFINMIAIRSTPAVKKTAATFLEEVKQSTLAAFDNQDYPFDYLVRKLGIQGKPGRNPLFDVGFLFHNQGDIDPQLHFRDDSINIRPYKGEWEHRVSRFDILVGAADTPDGIQLEVEFSTRLFKAETIKKMMMHYIEILQQLVENREACLQDIDISTGLVTADSNDIEIEFGF